MQIVKITIPYSGEMKEVQIQPEIFEGKKAYRVVFDDGDEEIIGLDEADDSWEQLNGENMDTDLVNEIGKAIEDTGSAPSS
ncbi:hypothetical protein [Rubrolithibacter danxiaensis]|uniref:hypothetical protein n=1 Tax=Rubrolithibacter danxiaensis TaxID=3390805 RepID=UPI003BF87A0A